jgi:uncharacterized peroxidase-related enzyme
MSTTTTAVRVDVVSEAEATGEVAELYDELRRMFLGFVPDVFKLVSTRPEMLRALVGGYRSMFDGGSLPRTAKEVVAVTVARTASCQFCTSAHEALLRLLDVDARYADAVVGGRLDDPVVPPDVRALAELARAVSQHAHRLTDDDLDRVRAHWDDEQVLEAVWVACLFNGIVRLADTLGLHYVGQLADEGDRASRTGEASGTGGAESPGTTAPGAAAGGDRS